MFVRVEKETTTNSRLTVVSYYRIDSIEGIERDPPLPPLSTDDFVTRCQSTARRIDTKFRSSVGNLRAGRGVLDGMEPTPRQWVIRWLLARDTPARFSAVREAIGTPEFALFVRRHPGIWEWADSVERVSAVKNLARALNRRRRGIRERVR